MEEDLQERYKFSLWTSEPGRETISSSQQNQGIPNAKTSVSEWCQEGILRKSLDDIQIQIVLVSFGLDGAAQNQNHSRPDFSILLTSFGDHHHQHHHHHHHYQGYDDGGVGNNLARVIARWNVVAGLGGRNQVQCQTVARHLVVVVRMITITMMVTMMMVTMMIYVSGHQWWLCWIILKTLGPPKGLMKLVKGDGIKIGKDHDNDNDNDNHSDI